MSEPIATHGSAERGSAPDTAAYRVLLCAKCPMKFNPALAEQLADDERGGTYTGWFLPEGSPAEPIDHHQHEVAPCRRLGCSDGIDADDGIYCSDICRGLDMRGL